CSDARGSIGPRRETAASSQRFGDASEDTAHALADHVGMALEAQVRRTCAALVAAYRSMAQLRLYGIVSLAVTPFVVGVALLVAGHGHRDARLDVPPSGGLVQAPTAGDTSLELVVLQSGADPRAPRAPGGR